MTYEDYKNIKKYAKTFDVDGYFKEYENTETNCKMFLITRYICSSTKLKSMSIKRYLGNTSDVALLNAALKFLSSDELYRFMVECKHFDPYLETDLETNLFKKISIKNQNDYLIYLINNDSLDKVRNYIKGLKISDEALIFGAEKGILFDMLSKGTITLGKVVIELMYDYLSYNEIISLIESKKWFFNDEQALKLFKKINSVPKHDLGVHPSFFVDLNPDFTFKAQCLLDDDVLNYHAKFKFLELIKKPASEDLKKEIKQEVLKTNDDYLIATYIVEFDDIDIPNEKFKTSCKLFWDMDYDKVFSYIKTNIFRFTEYELYSLLMYAECFSENSYESSYSLMNDSLIGIINNASDDKFIIHRRKALDEFVKSKLNEIDDAINNNDFTSLNEIDVCIERIFGVIGLLDKTEGTLYFKNKLIDIVIAIEKLGYVKLKCNLFHIVNNLGYKDDAEAKECRKKVYNFLFGEANEIDVFRLNKYKDKLLDFMLPYYDQKEIEMLTPYYLNSMDYYSLKFLDQMNGVKSVDEYVYNSNNKDFIAYLIFLNREVKPNKYFKTVIDAFKYLLSTPIKFIEGESYLRLMDSNKRYEEEQDVKITLYK